MGMSMNLDGFNEFVDGLTKVFSDAELMYKKGVYNGAKILADEVKKGLNGLRVDDGYGTAGRPLHGVSQNVKESLVQGMGVSRIEFVNGSANVAVGFDGYDNIKTKKHPNGRPIQMLMRSVESGTSFMTKQPVIRQATNRAKKQVEEAIEKTVSDFIGERVK